MLQRKNCLNEAPVKDVLLAQTCSLMSFNVLHWLNDKNLILLYSIFLFTDFIVILLIPLIFSHSNWASPSFHGMFYVVLCACDK